MPLQMPFCQKSLLQILQQKKLLFFPWIHGESRMGKSDRRFLNSFQEYQTNVSSNFNWNFIYLISDQTPINEIKWIDIRDWLYWPWLDGWQNTVSKHQTSISNCYNWKNGHSTKAISIEFPTFPLLASAVLITTRLSKINKQSNWIAKAIQIQWKHMHIIIPNIDYRLPGTRNKQIPNSNWTTTRICNETNRKRIKFSVPGFLFGISFHYGTHLVVDFEVLIIRKMAYINR